MPNKKTPVKTNKEKDSVKEVQLKAVTFKELWDNYPAGHPYEDPNGQYSNQCAIKMSVTFHKTGSDMKSFSQKNVKPMPGKESLGRLLLEGKPTATRAYELAQWLKLKPILGIASPETITGKDWEDKVKDRTGIIFFFGYWQQDGDNKDNLTGGHIDLWNKDTLTSKGFASWATSFARFRLRQSSLWYSDLAKSKEILFWEVK